MVAHMYTIGTYEIPHVFWNLMNNLGFVKQYVLYGRENFSKSGETLVRGESPSITCVTVEPTENDSEFMSNLEKTFSDKFSDKMLDKACVELIDILYKKAHEEDTTDDGKCIFFDSLEDNAKYLQKTLTPLQKRCFKNVIRLMLDKDV